ncbi:hypothetical protein Tco_0680582 [Tanacetum coccineum]|uniref:Uncharacterized protein n=1 Tax=Tanacetum coccineum TaxID=301880 RepID=A0ABQ4XM59_9ASTR
MRLNQLYKFSDRTLVGLRTSLDDITKNIHMEYFPKRRWSSLKKKRAHIMIKAINKLLKERIMMRSLEKFVEHQSDTKVIHNDDGNPSRANVKQALGSILTDSKEYIKMDLEVPGSSRLKDS